MVDAASSNHSLRLLGHGLGAGAGIAALAGGIAAATSALPGVLGATMLVLGVVLPALVYRSLRRSRAAWSFLIALLSVLAVVTLFGAPKVRNVLGTSLPAALVIPALLAVTVVVLSRLRADYRPGR